MNGTIGSMVRFLAAGLPLLIGVAVTGALVLLAGLAWPVDREPAEGRLRIWRAIRAALLALPVFVALALGGAIRSPAAVGWPGRVGQALERIAVNGAGPLLTGRTSPEAAGVAGRDTPVRKTFVNPSGPDARPPEAMAREAGEDAGGARVHSGAAFVVFAWLIGLLLVSARLVAGLAALGGYGRTSVPAPLLERWALRRLQRDRRIDGLRIRRGGPFAVPVCWGVLRPTILLPPRSADWTVSRTRTVLAHELAHLIRRDPAQLVLMRFAVAVHWFNPLAWILQARLKRDMEEACDEVVLRSGVSSTRYARVLLEAAADLRGRGRPPGMLMAMAARETLVRRIERVLAGAPPPVRPFAGWGGVLAVLLVAGATTMAAVPAPSPVTPPSAASPAVVSDTTTLDRIVDLLVAALADPAASVRRTALSALRPVGGERGRAAIQSMLDDSAEEVRAAAERALGLRPNVNMEVPPSSAPRPASRAVLDSLERGLQNPDFHVRLASAWRLGNLADPRSTPVLVARLEDVDFHVRDAAASALGHIGDRRAVPALVARLTDEDFHVRQAAVSALGHIGDRRAVEPLIAAWPDPEEHVRGRIVSALGELGKALLPTSPATGADPAAMAAPAAMAPPPAASPEACRSEPGEAEPFDVRSVVTTLLRDPDPGLRRRAATRLGDPAALERMRAAARADEGDPSSKDYHHALVTAVSDPDDGVRVAAACSLAAVGDARALDALAMRSRDGEAPAVRAASRWAATRIQRRADAR